MRSGKKRSKKEIEEIDKKIYRSHFINKRLQNAYLYSIALEYNFKNEGEMLDEIKKMEL